MAKSLSCTVCGKKFAMPAHLGRHMSAMHGAPSRSSTKAKKKKGGKRGRPRKVVAAPAVSGLPDVSGALTAACNELLAQRDAIDARLSAYEIALKSLGMAMGAAAPKRGPGRPKGSKGKGKGKPGRPAGRKPGRPKKGKKRGRPAGSGRGYRAGSLNDHILGALKESGAVMTIADIEKAVLKAGYKTKSAKLANAINNTMGKLKGAKRVGRGQYRAA
ncbi:MAG: C2H2-type zinc finger protein [Phycisphaerales bacterium]|nr:C2H2-type zinc finger protein [Phycisphaerales bacterium]